MNPASIVPIRYDLSMFKIINLSNAVCCNTYTISGTSTQLLKKMFLPNNNPTVILYVLYLN